MANSGYYYNLYIQYGNQVSSLQNKISVLEQIRNNLAGNFYDEQSEVNKELNDLKYDLKKSVRHDSAWNINASICELNKEKASTADENLSDAIDSMNAEISSLMNRESTAEANRDQAYRDYTREKEAERQEWLKILQELANYNK